MNFREFRNHDSRVAIIISNNFERQGKSEIGLYPENHNLFLFGSGIATTIADFQGVGNTSGIENYVVFCRVQVWYPDFIKGQQKC